MAADDSVKSLVAEITLQPTGWADTVKQMRAQLSQVADDDKANAVQAAKASGSAIDYLKQQAALSAALTAEAKATVAQEAAKAAAIKTSAEAAAEQVKSQLAAATLSRAQATAQEAATKAAMAAQIAAASTQLNAERLITEQKRKHVAAAAEELAETKKLAAEKAKEASEERKIAQESRLAAREQKEQNENSLRGRLSETLGSGLFGKNNTGGSVASTGLMALLGGGTGALTLAAGGAAFEGLEKLLDKIKEFTEDSGGLQKLLETFEKLAATHSTGATEFLEQLETATLHLVPEVDLLRTANAFMQSGLKISSEDMVKLTASTVALSRAQGNDAGQAVQALGRYFLTGHARTLSYATGIKQVNFALRGVSPETSVAAKSQMELAHTMKVINDRADALGPVALTYTDRLKQMAVLSNEFFEDVAQGAVKSSGFSILLGILDRLIGKFSKLGNASTNIGKLIGSSFVVVAAVFKNIEDVIARFGKAWNDIFEGTKTNKTLTAIQAIARAFAVVAEMVNAAVTPILLMLDTIDALAKASNDPKLKDRARISSDLREKGGVANTVRADVFGVTSGYDKDYAAAVKTNLGDSVGKEERRITEFHREMNRMVQSIGDKDTTPKGTGIDIQLPDDPGLDRKNALQEAAATTQAKIKAAQEWLAQKKTLDDEEKEDNENLYKDGKESAEDYYNTKRQLAERALHESVFAILAEANLQKKEIEYQAKLGEFDQTTKTMKLAGVDDDTKKKVSDAQRQKSRQDSQIQREQDQENIEAHKQAIQEQLQVTLKGFEDQKEALKAAQSESTITASSSLTGQIGIIQEETAAKIKAATETFLSGEKGPRQYADALKSIAVAGAEASKELDALKNQSVQSVFSDVNQRYSAMLNQNQGLQGLLASPGGFGATGGETQENLQRQQQQLLQSQISSLEALATQATPYSNTWNQIVDSIVKAQTALQGLNAEMAENQSKSYQTASIFGTMAQQGESIFKGSFGQGFVQSLGQGAKSFQDTFKMNQQFGGTKQTDPALQALIDQAKDVSDGMRTASQESTTGLTQFYNALQQATPAINDMAAAAIKMAAAAGGGSSSSNSEISQFSKGITDNGHSSDWNTVSNLGGSSPIVKGPPSSSGDGGGSGVFGALGTSITGLIHGDTGSFAAFSKALQGAIQQIGSFISTISNAKSPLAGAFGGGLSGSSLGGSIGSAFKGIKDAGPIGAIVGAIGGTIMGLISGAKNQQIHQNIIDMTQAYNAIMAATAAGTASITQQMTQIQALVNQANAQAANSKKGSAQYTQEAQQYNQQLQQLQAQVTATMASLHEQLQVLSAPDAYQQWVQNIDSVVDQYKTFAAAAQNATELGQANQYLSQSLQAIGLQMGEQLQTDEETAIQQALDLNTALNQRNALERQYLDQVHSVMSQGSLTRQVTTAQSKFSQLYDAAAQYNQQMDQMNQEINLDQAQVSAAQQVFNLATTRSGLEQQLLNLQKAGIAQDMSRISAMQNLLQILGQTGYSLTGGTSAADPNALVAAILAALLGQVPGTSGSNSALGTLLGILSGSGGIPGGATSSSGQYTAWTGSVAPKPSSGSSGSTTASVSLLDAATAGAYAKRASFGYGQFRGQNL
jgi:hypothetical protein